MQPDANKKAQCPDCQQCQMCSKSRCRQCRKGAGGARISELGSSFTHGQYLEWKNKKSKLKRGHIKETGLSACPDEELTGVCKNAFLPRNAAVESGI